MGKKKDNQSMLLFIALVVTLILLVSIAILLSKCGKESGVTNSASTAITTSANGTTQRYHVTSVTPTGTTPYKTENQPVQTTEKKIESGNETGQAETLTHGTTASQTLPVATENMTGGSEDETTTEPEAPAAVMTSTQGAPETTRKRDEQTTIATSSGTENGTQFAEKKEEKTVAPTSTVKPEIKETLPQQTTARQIAPPATKTATTTVAQTQVTRATEKSTALKTTTTVKQTAERETTQAPTSSPYQTLPAIETTPVRETTKAPVPIETTAQKTTPAATTRYEPKTEAPTEKEPTKATETTARPQQSTEAPASTESAKETWGGWSDPDWTLGEWVVTKAATQTEPGEETRISTRTLERISSHGRIERKTETRTETRSTKLLEDSWGNWVEGSWDDPEWEWSAWRQIKAPSYTEMGKEERVGTRTLTKHSTRTSAAGKVEKKTETKREEKYESRSIPAIEDTWGEWVEVSRTDPEFVFGEWVVIVPLTDTQDGVEERIGTRTIEITYTRSSASGLTDTKTTHMTETKTEQKITEH